MLFPAERLLEVFILTLPPVLLDLSCKGVLERDFTDSDVLILLLQLPPELLDLSSFKGAIERDFTDSVEWNRVIFLSREFLLIMSLNSSLDNFPSESPSFLRKTASTWLMVRLGEDSSISTLLINPSPLASITLNKSSITFVCIWFHPRFFNIYTKRKTHKTWKMK